MTRAAVLALALVSMASLAGAQTAVPTVDRRQVLIEYSAPTQLSNAFMVVDIRIANRSGQARTWGWEFNAVDGTSADAGRRSRFELEVEDGHDRRFEILVPLTAPHGTSWVQMAVHGYGVTNPGQKEVLGSAVHSKVAVSTNATLRAQEVHEQTTADPSVAEATTFTFAAEALAGDWRAYSGLSALWLTEDEWRRGSPPVRRAITEWVAGGGRLVLVATEDQGSSSSIERRGVGTVVTIPEGLTAEGAAALHASLDPGFFSWVQTDDGESISWISSLIDPIETHKGLLSLILLGYLVLAGPVNLLVLSPGTKRVRLYWTMPAIALGASTLLGIVILLQDGVGGEGYRGTLVYLQPGLNRELVVQEQISKTGALLRRSFDLDEAVVVTSLATDYRSYRRPLRVNSTGSRYDGDWFRSRSLQAHRLVSARSSRAGIERVGEASGAPRISSSIEASLEKLFFRDARGEVWYGENVRPGRPVTLLPSTEQAYQRFCNEASYGVAGPGPEIRARVGAIHALRGAFLATTSVSDGVAIDTLTSVDWADAPIVYAGHIGHPREMGR